MHNGQGGIENPEERGDARAKIKIRKVGVRNQLLIEILKNSPSPRKLKKIIGDVARSMSVICC